MAFAKVGDEGCSAHGVMSPTSLSSMLESTALTDGKGLYQVPTLVGL